MLQNLIIISIIFSSSNIQETINSSITLISSIKKNEIIFNKEEIKTIKRLNKENITFKQKTNKVNIENIMQIQIFFSKLLDELSHKFINKDPTVFNTIINNAIKINNFNIKIHDLINEQYSLDFYNTGNCDLPHPIDIKLDESHIISLLYMIKMNTPLLNTLITYSRKKRLKIYLNKLKNKKEGKIEVSYFKSFISENYHKNIKYEINDFINSIISNICNNFTSTFFLFPNYSVLYKNNEKIVVKHLIDDGFFYRYLGNPILSRFGRGISIKPLNPELPIIIDQDLDRVMTEPIFLKAPNYLIIDIREIKEKEILIYFPLLEKVLYNFKYINKVNLYFIIYSILIEGPIKYELTGFITMKEIKNTNGDDFSCYYKPYFKYKNNWNEDFNNIFKINPLNSDIKVNEDYENKIKIITLFYKRVYNNEA